MPEPRWYMSSDALLQMAESPAPFTDEQREEMRAEVDQRRQPTLQDLTDHLYEHDLLFENDEWDAVNKLKTIREILAWYDKNKETRE